MVLHRSSFDIFKLYSDIASPHVCQFVCPTMGTEDSESEEEEGPYKMLGSSFLGPIWDRTKTNGESVLLVGSFNDVVPKRLGVGNK
jgi:hypothetical protein